MRLLLAAGLAALFAVGAQAQRSVRVGFDSSMTLSKEPGPRSQLLVLKERIIWQAGGWVVAAEAATGKQNWYMAAVESGAAPRLQLFAIGEDYVVLLAPRSGQVRVVRPRNGMLLWTKKFASKELRGWAFGNELLLRLSPGHYQKVSARRGQLIAELQVEVHRQKVADAVKTPLPVILDGGCTLTEKGLVVWAPAPLRFDTRLAFVDTLDVRELSHDDVLAAVPTKGETQWMQRPKELVLFDRKKNKVSKTLSLAHEVTQVLGSSDPGIVALTTAKGCYLFAPANSKQPVYLPVGPGEIKGYSMQCVLAVKDNLPTGYSISRKGVATHTWTGEPGLPTDGAVDGKRYLFVRDGKLVAIDLSKKGGEKVLGGDTLTWIARIRGRLVGLAGGQLRQVVVKGSRHRAGWHCTLAEDVGTVLPVDLDVRRKDRWFVRPGTLRLVELLPR